MLTGSFHYNNERKNYSIEDQSLDTIDQNVYLFSRTYKVVNELLYSP